MGSSIRFRLWSAATISILVALAIAGIGLRYLFERHVERRIEAELFVDLDRLIAKTDFSADGSTLQVASDLTDPRFETPESGFYWQVEDIQTHKLIRSRSLWDSVITMPKGEATRRRLELSGPGGALLVGVQRTIVDPNGRSFRAVVAEDHQTVADSVRDYIRELTPALLLLALVLIAAIFVQITVGLAPLESLRVAVRDVIARRSKRLDVVAPREVQPLAVEINRLLEAQEKALTRARSRATDLAHGLKTPLQVLSADIRALRNKGETELANEIAQSADAIRRHVERELARTRLATGVAEEMECKVAETAERVVSVVKRTPEGERLAFVVDVDGHLTAPIDEGDLAEILGNLIENAARFARSTVHIAGEKKATGTTISIADDGPGIPDADKPSVLSRGVRLDENASGFGLGLAIVSDIVEAYGGSMTMADAGPGLEVIVFLPRQA